MLLCCCCCCALAAASRSGARLLRSGSGRSVEGEVLGGRRLAPKIRIPRHALTTLSTTSTAGGSKLVPFATEDGRGPRAANVPNVSWTYTYTAMAPHAELSGAEWVWSPLVVPRCFAIALVPE